MRATTPPLPFFSGNNSLTRTGAVMQFSQDSTWPHLCSCLPVALSTHLRETRAYHPISEVEGQYPSSNQNSSPSFFYSVGIPHGHTFVHATGAFNTPTRTKGSSPTLSGRSPTSRVERSSPSVPLRDSTWPHFRARHWRFQHTYEGKKAHPPP